MTLHQPEPDWTPPDLSYLNRYLSDPAFAASEDAKAKAEHDAFWGPIRARDRAQQEIIWAADDLPDMELRA